MKIRKYIRAFIIGCILGFLLVFMVEIITSIRSINKDIETLKTYTEHLLKEDLSRFLNEKDKSKEMPIIELYSDNIKHRI